MRVLVTGGAGYIGAHAAKALYRTGHEPVVLDDLSAGHVEFVRYGPMAVGDVRDEELVYAVLTRFQVEAVMHFAAKAVVSESMQEPERYLANNVGGTVSLLAAMRRAGVRRLVFSSSAAVYGESEAHLLSESHSLQPTNPYGLSKLQAEQAIAAVAQALGLRYAILRYFNVVGADADGQLWEAHEPETHLVPNLVRAAVRKTPFHLYGTDYPTADGTAVRDYVDVADLAEVHREALHALEERPVLISNVGHGTGMSVREVIAAVEQVFEVPVDIREEPRRSGDPPVLVADAAFLRQWSAAARDGLRPLAESLRTMRAHALRHGEA